jgi:carbon monoxide dehydrogenase subunit G
VLGDPHHLPRWWPRVSRVESVDEHAFTEVLMSGKGKMVRADFRLLDAISLRRVVWSQQVANTPFARILTSAETEINLSDTDAGDGPATEVTIELRQTMHGFLARMGSHLVRRAAGSTIEEALDGLERIVERRA